MATPVLTALPQALDLVGKLDLPEVAAVLARAIRVYFARRTDAAGGGE
jgi:hypothetical protein